MLSRKMLLFPAANAINFFSITVLLIISGLLGEGTLAADIAVIQSATLAIFFSLSSNARNLILASNSEYDEGNLFYFRLITLGPAAFTAMFLCNAITGLDFYLIVGLILRKCSEWVAELQLANKEKNDDQLFAERYITINTFGFIFLVLLLIFSPQILFCYMLYIWALLPIIFSWPYIRWACTLTYNKPEFQKLIPHLGSTVVIGFSTYIFRILIVILAGKLIAGQMFTAYALGGMFSSLYTYAFGPTVIQRESNRTWEVLAIFFLFCFFIGIAIILLSGYSSFNIYSPLFLSGIGYSIIGGGIMLIAQRQRLLIIQISKKDVFVPDALANILLIASIPFAYYTFGTITFVVLFLWSGILNLLFYSPIAYKYRYEGD